MFTFWLVKPATPEVVGDNHIRHGVENKLDVLCVCGAGHVAVDLLRRRLVLCLKLGLHEHSVKSMQMHEDGVTSMQKIMQIQI